MISEIIMAAVASYKEETKLATDRKINLIFGLNGTGKSTLSNFLYEPSAPEFSQCRLIPESLDAILVYNQRFIQDNFYVADSLKGIFSLSKENKAAAEKIGAAQTTLLELNKHLESTLTRKVTTERNFNRQRQQAIDEIWKIKTTYSGGDRVLEYCLKGLMGEKDKLFSYLINIEKPSSEPEKSTKQIKEEVEALKGDSAQPQTMLPMLPINVHDIESDPLFGRPVIGNDNSAVAGLIEKLGNSDWVKQGLDYLPDDMAPNGVPCPFCQETTITSRLVESVRNYFDETYQAAINQLEALQDRYKNSRSAVIGLEPYTSNKFAEGRIASIAKKSQYLTEILDRNLITIETKLKNPRTILKLRDSTQALASFNQEITSINAAIKAHNDKLQNRDATLIALKDEFWFLMRWQYSQTVERYRQDLASTTSALATINAEIKQIDTSINAAKARIKEAQKESVNVEEAVDAVNSGLLDLGIADFNIAKHSNNLYRVVRGSDSTDAFHTLSEGEKMMISFLYFCELCKGRQSATDTETTKIAVIDDPISSLSHVFIFNVGQLIRNVFFKSDRFHQVFVLTHSLYFFYELTDPNHDRRKLNQNLFRMSKTPTGSKIQEMKYEEIQNDYQAYWTVINDPEQPPALIANCMRNIIEYFFNFVRRRDLNNVFQMPELQDVKFQAFSRYVNRESHSLGQNIIDMKEFDYSIFKEGLRLVFEATGYAEHFKAMAKGAGAST